MWNPQKHHQTFALPVELHVPRSVFVAVVGHGVEPAQNVDAIGHRVLCIRVHVSQEVLTAWRYGTIRRNAVVTVNQTEAHGGGVRAAVIQYSVLAEMLYGGVKWHAHAITVGGQSCLEVDGGLRELLLFFRPCQIGRASCRERV